MNGHLRRTANQFNQFKDDLLLRKMEEESPQDEEFFAVLNELIRKTEEMESRIERMLRESRLKDEEMAE